MSLTFFSTGITNVCTDLANAFSIMLFSAQTHDPGSAPANRSAFKVQFNASCKLPDIGFFQAFYSAMSTNCSAFVAGINALLKSFMCHNLIF
jgi:hypothetical protein